MNITPPTNSERDRSIEAILSEGLTKPVSTWAFLRDMCRRLGLRVIFWDAAPAMLVSLMAAAGYLMLISMQFVFLEAGGNLRAMLFLFSPALFICMTVCTEALERTSGIYEIKMTSKYTIWQITAFRMLCFSLVGTVFAVISNAVMYSLSAGAQAGYFIQMLSIALCSLFLCSLLIIHTMRRWRGGWYMGAIIWTAAGMLPVLLFREAWENFLIQLPPALAVCIAAAAYVLFLREIKITTREVYNYANS